MSTSSCFRWLFVGVLWITWSIGSEARAEAAWKAADETFQTYGGFAFAKEYQIERKWREVRLWRTAPISNNMVLNFLSQNVLGLPRSY